MLTKYRIGLWVVGGETGRSSDQRVSASLLRGHAHKYVLEKENEDGRHAWMKESEWRYWNASEE